jgi:class 3 adenylate cyclase
MCAKIGVPDRISVPILDELAPGGFFYGGLYIVEFDPASLWYETSLTIAARALKERTKVEYHTFQHPPGDVAEAFARLGISVREFEKDGYLRIVDSYTQTLEYEEKKAEDSYRIVKTVEKPLDLVRSADNWAKESKAGYTDEDMWWLHVDDDTGVVLQYNDEKTVIDKWRTGILPYSVRNRMTPHFIAFTRNAALDRFLSQFEVFCDGIIDLTTREEVGEVKNYLRLRLLRGRIFDSRLHQLQMAPNGEVGLVEMQYGESRKLAAIMFTDIVGYTAMTQENELRALDTLKKHREILRPIILKHGGKEVKTIGDAFLIEFSSALAAIECATDIERAIQKMTIVSAEDLRVKIGIHLGDVVHEDGDVYGDAVNVASRIVPLAKGGGICISQQVYDQVRNKTDLKFKKLPAQDLKNISIPLNVYKLGLE